MLRLILPDIYKGVRERHAQGPLDDWEPGFVAYLREERGLSEATIKLYEGHLRRFEQYLCQAGLENLTGLSPDLLDRFIATSSKSLCRASLPALCSTLRLLLRYLYRQQATARDLSLLIEAPKNYRLSTIPRSIPWEDVRRTLESVDRRSAIGKRDYAMLLLLVSYGLRAREVAALTLDDIDWRSEKIAIRMRKAGHSAVYPLSSATGEALLDYLKHGRPETAERCVFLRARAPRIPISHRIVSLQAVHYLRKAGVKVARPGSHTFRHSCAQRLVDADFSLKVVGDYLGHRSASSTEIYSKVAIEALREVALGDGEEIL
jgi:site-specific recombinase XerD